MRKIHRPVEGLFEVERDARSYTIIRIENSN